MQIIPNHAPALSGAPSSLGVLLAVERGAGLRAWAGSGSGWAGGGSGGETVLPGGPRQVCRRMAPTRKKGHLMAERRGPWQDEGGSSRLTLQGTWEAYESARGWESAWGPTGVAGSPPSPSARQEALAWRLASFPDQLSPVLHGLQAGGSWCVGVSSALHAAAPLRLPDLPCGHLESAPPPLALTVHACACPFLGTVGGGSVAGDNWGGF